MSFDECIGYPATYEYCKNSVERTLRWAKRGKDVFNNPNQSLFGIVQGGEYEDLRKHCVEELVKMDFDGYSIGGTSVGEDKKTQYKMVRYATSYLPKDKVRYLMGVGDPIDIVENVCNGIDIFDCVSPTRLARHGHALTRFGKINIKNAKYKEDFTPIEDACTCYACQNYTKAYIKHLINCEETFGARLLSIHNIHYLINLTEELRQAIKEDRLLEYREEFIKITMETASKIISFILIILMIGLVGYKSYTAVENSRNAKLWLVLNKKVVEKANDCHLDKNAQIKRLLLNT